MPRVSVIIPAYNHVNYIRQCIDSVLAQTYRDYEIVVVDDGSTDGTADILQAYGDRIRYVRQTNAGTQVARNHAISLSQGQYIALLDSDDAWFPRRLEREMALFDVEPSIGMIYSKAVVIDQDGVADNPAVTFGRRINRDESAFVVLLHENPIPTLTTLIRRDVLPQDEPFDTSYVGASDRDLWLRIAARHTIAFVDEPLALYRVHRTNTTNLLKANLGVYQERHRVLHAAMQRNPELVTDQVRARAEANLCLQLVECHLLARDLDAAAEALGRAVDYDVSIVEQKLVATLATWLGHPRGHLDSVGTIVTEVTRLVSDLSLPWGHRDRLQRQLISRRLLDKAFVKCGSGDALGQLWMTFLGILVLPREVLDRGLWRRSASAVCQLVGLRKAPERTNAES